MYSKIYFFLTQTPSKNLHTSVTVIFFPKKITFHQFPSHTRLFEIQRPELQRKGEDKRFSKTFRSQIRYNSFVSSIRELNPVWAIHLENLGMKMGTEEILKDRCKGWISIEMLKRKSIKESNPSECLKIKLKKWRITRGGITNDDKWGK